MNHIHLIAICGTGMGSLAGLLKEKGFVVSGSDQNVYPPMSTKLLKMGVTLYQGYRAENISSPHPVSPVPKIDLVIIGNAVSKDNPEVQEVLRQEIPYLSMPQALSQFFISGKKSMVVAGTHGKTTTTALLAHLLTELKTDPGYLIGGILQGNQKNYSIGNGPYFVVEGDEYDTAFFDKGPKFLHYQPHDTLITSLEFDHADIYRDLDHMSESFEALVQKINPQGYLLACAHYPRLVKILKKAACEVETYGIKVRAQHAAPVPKNDKIDWTAADLVFKNDSTFFDVFFGSYQEIRLQSPLAGEHNVLNVLASFAMLRKLNFNPDDIQKALFTFAGVKRRQEVKAVISDRVILDDFAHHPTAVAETIAAMKTKYPTHRLWAVFEPRSNTSKRDVFQTDYVHAFQMADEVILADVFNPEKVKDGKVLDVDRLSKDVLTMGVSCHHISGVEAIVSYLVTHTKPKSVILIMSNGGFGGIHEKLISSLKS